MSDLRDREKRADEFNERRALRTYEDLTYRPRRTLLRWLLIGTAIVVALSLFFGVIGWIGGWWDTAKRVTGPANTERQAFALRDDYKSLEATAGNVCDVGKPGSSAQDDPTLVEHPDFAYRAQYRRIKADYDRRMDNAFEAGWVRHYPFLNDLPREAPTLNVMQEKVC